MSVKVSPTLIGTYSKRYEIVSKAVSVLESDPEVTQLLRMSNVMAVSRLGYNDHGPVHARIVAGAALELLERLLKHGVKPSSIENGVAKSEDESRAIVVFASFLHDVGNSVHRDMHELLGALLAKDIVDRLLPKVLGNLGARLYALRQEILHTIHATAYDMRCLTVEAGVVKVADGLDMSEGRARIPYELGKIDMHSVSALSIKRVDIESGDKRPIRVVVRADDMAGLFQIERVLLPKIKTSGLEDYIEVAVYTGGRLLMTYPR